MRNSGTLIGVRTPVVFAVNFLGASGQNLGNKGIPLYSKTWDLNSRNGGLTFHSLLPK